MKDLTPVAIAAHQAADREPLRVLATDAYVQQLRSLYIKAFLAGTQWQQQDLMPLVSEWRKIVNNIGSDPEGEAFKQCANQLEAIAKGESR